MDTSRDEPRDNPKITAIRRLQDQVDRQGSPLRQIQQMQNLANRYTADSRPESFARAFDYQREIQEVLKYSAVPKHVQEIIDGSSISAQFKRVMEQQLVNPTFPALVRYSDIIRRANDLALGLKPISEHQKMLERLRYQSLGGFAAVDFTRHLEEANPALRAIEEARKSFDRFWSTLRDIDFSQFEASAVDEQEAEEAAESITKEAAEQKSFQAAVERIVSAIQSQQKPAVQLLLWLIFCKTLEVLYTVTLTVLITPTAQTVLGDSPQAAKKAIQEKARTAAGSPLLLVEYRYVTAKVLIVRQNPKALSPELGRLSFGKAVKLLKKENDFALVLWTDSESGAEIQGWVFARHLGKFN